MGKYYKRFEEVARLWISELDKYNDEPFKRKPEGVARSVGAIYAHLLQQANEVFIPFAIDCADQRKPKEKGGKSFRGRTTFMRSTLSESSKRTKEFEKNPPEAPKSTMEARNQMIKLMKRMGEVEPKLKSANPKYKIKHPELGALNAMEWYQLVEFSYRYHFKFKEEVDKQLIGQPSNYKE